jgi:hypothetical protein
MFTLRSKARNHVADYLAVIRPWATGRDSRGWVNEDFFERKVIVPGGDMEWTPIEDVKDYRTDPSHVIFPLIPYEITLLDRLFLDRRMLNALLNLNQGISNFNAMVAAFAAAQTVETRWTAAVMLHTGVIGTTGTGGLYSRYMLVVEAF